MSQVYILEVEMITRPYNFNIKMKNNFPTQFQGEQMLSPKQSEQRKARSMALKKIDREIDQILSLNAMQNNQYKGYMENIIELEQHYKIENTRLQSALQLANQKYEALENMYNSLKEELENIYNAYQNCGLEKQMLSTENEKLKDMVKNQEKLIDEYRKNIDEEISLEREFMKAQFEETKLKLEKDFNRILMQVEKQYEEKVKKMSRNIKMEEYKLECKEFKKLLASQKNHSQKTLYKCESGVVKPMYSQYSTTDQENRHNQPTFML